MGLYDELGYEQVKCFPDAIVKYCKKWDSDSEEEVLESYELGGKLKYFRRGHIVPYITLYYNYGKDFMIFDYRNEDKNGYIPVHIIRNGRYLRSVDYRCIPNRYKIGLVINKYGDILNVYTKSDFKQLVKEFKYYEEIFRKEYTENEKVKAFLAREIEFDENFENIVNEIANLEEEVISKTFDIFTKNWVNIGIDDWSKYSCNELLNWENFNSSEKEDIKVHGGYVIGCLLHSIQNDYYSQDERKRVIKGYVEKIKGSNKSFDGMLMFYLKWCEMSKIDIDREKVEHLLIDLDLNVIEYLKELEQRICNGGV